MQFRSGMTKSDVGDFVPLQYRTILGEFVTHTLYREVYTDIKYVLMWSLKETIE